MDVTGKAASNGHKWKFVRVGGVDQVVIRDGEDIAHIPELDQKLWVALAMPKKIAGIPAETLDALDTDKDGRIRAPEIIATIRFLKERLPGLSPLSVPGDSLRVTSIAPASLRDSALWILGMIGKGGAQEISLSDLAAASEVFGLQRFNGDGIMPPDSAGEDSASRVLIEDILKCLPGVADASGVQGVDAPALETFTAQARAYAAWMDAFGAAEGAVGGNVSGARAANDPASKTASIAAAVASTEAVRAKIDDWFFRCHLAALEGGAQTDPFTNGKEEDRDRLLRTSITVSNPDLLSLPLARIDPAGKLSLKGPFNPGWTTAMAAFRSSVLLPRSGSIPEVLDSDGWEDLKAAIAPFAAWMASKPEGAVELLGLARIQEILGSDAMARLAALVAEDVAWSEKRLLMAELRKMLLFRRDLPRIVNNFVNFSEFYNHKSAAVFQAGTLYIDGRACTLCLEVDDPGRHGSLASMSATYLAYCACTRPDGAKKTIVAAFTAGDGDNLFVGRNGVFYDRDGKDWDATVTKLMPQPISIREAFWSPYKWLGKTFEEIVGKRASAADASSQAKLKGATETAVAGVADGKKVEPPKKFEVGTVAAIGVALGSIGAMVTGILGTFLGLGVWMPAGILGALLMISGPSMILAYFKLRRRNLGPVLDASGWAINGRLKINVPFGRTLTYTAALPSNAERSLIDPYAEKKRPWKLILAASVILILAILWLLGGLNQILPRNWWYSTLIGK